METEPTQNPPREFQVGCRKCARVLKVPDFIIDAYPTAGEQYAFLAKVAEANGWGHGIDWISGEQQAVFVCPEHVVQSAEANDRILAKYDSNSRCAACGEGNANVKHCRGLVSTCELGAPRLHLHRTCVNCGFEWLEGRLDDPKVK